jgi:2-polyprenyl-3-methyl-5-hydroxy-6-metoxy-1,4-benzoquinol methylase
MTNKEKTQHWEKIYQTKNFTETSWYQSKPTTTLNFLKQFKISKSAKIIDIGGGDSYLVDHLLQLGYTNITVLDISESALQKAKQRLGTQAQKVKWIVADIANFQPTEQYDFWHDRAVFHFLTNETEADNYIQTIQQYLTPKGILIMGTFSENGPTKCSGIDIKQYSETTMTQRLQKFFHKIKCITEDHLTPFNTIQNFIFCSFSKLG